MKFYWRLLVLFFMLSPAALIGQTNYNSDLSPNAPTDRPHLIKDSVQLAKYDQLVAPYVKQALKTLPKAKKRFLSGLKNGEAFFLTTRIFDTNGNFEQIFVKVTGWTDSNVKGTIANEIGTVKGFKFGQLIEFPESAILDWLITKPNGDEEGNYVGKFLDTLR